MWSSWTEKAKEALEKTSAALETTGEAITQAATKGVANAGITKTSLNDRDFEKKVESVEKEVSDTSNPIISMPSIPKVDKDKVMNLWSTVVETTKKAAEDTKRAADDAMMATKDAVETSRSTLEQQFQLKRGFYKRDLKLPLDVDALRDAEVVYITGIVLLFCTTLSCKFFYFFRSLFFLFYIL